MITHVVMMKFKPEVGEQDIEELEALAEREVVRGCTGLVERHQHSENLEMIWANL